MMKCAYCGRETEGIPCYSTPDGWLQSDNLPLCGPCFGSGVITAYNPGEDGTTVDVTAPVMEYHVLAIFVGCEDDPAATFGSFSSLELAEKCCLSLAARPTIFSARIIGQKVN